MYTHTHTHTHTQHVSAYEVEAEIPLQALFCSDYTVTDRKMSSMTPSPMSLEVMEAMAAFYQLAS